MIIATAALWWVLLQLFGLVALPLAFSLFTRLPDRGYTLARPLGLLLSGYLLWMGGTLGFWKNGVSATLVALALVGGVGWWLYAVRLKQGDISLCAWVRNHAVYVLCVELLFGLALLGWTIFKAHNPDIETTGGEKWMEIAFVNATLRSEHFPPQDPWLSGYGISYYYFGYVLMAMVTHLSGLPATTAYNLFVPTLFALTLSGAFGLVYNLVAVRQREDGHDRSGQPKQWMGMFYGLMGAVFVGVMGNLEGFLEVLHSRGLLPASFWYWLDIKDINVAPLLEGGWIPTRFMWWWRASRVIHDCSLQGLATGNCNPPGGDWEVIDEFPFFSFLLGDVHPHVLALPFVLLGLGLILNAFIRAEVLAEEHTTSAKATTGLVQRLTRLVREVFGGWLEFILVAVCLGGLGFLNTWDFPIYLAVMSVAIAAARAQRSTNWASEALTMGLGLGLLGVGLYVPFYIGFQSQASGLLPNLFNPTKVQQFLVFFGPFLFAIVGYLILISSRQRWRLYWRRLPPLLLATVVAPIAAMLTMMGVAAVSPALRPHIDGILYDPHMQSLLDQPSVGSLMLLALRLHWGNPLTWLLLSGLLIWIGLIWPSHRPASDYPVQTTSLSSPDRFVLLMTSFGLALPLIVEFVYLRDNFGIRMNTVFKFYYQAWILLAVSAAYGIWTVHRCFLRAQMPTGSERSGALWQSMLRGLWGLVMVCLVLAGLVYPILSTPSKVAHYEDEPQLDGMEWLSKVYPGDYAAIRWLQANVPGEAVILEAPGDRYAAYDYVGRVSALTGLATLLGWGNHEHQWRGSYEVPARREPDIEALFNGLDPSRTTALLDQYDIAYVYVGTLERKRYRADGLAKFEKLMEAIYRQGDVVIYQRR
ncbi:MAG: DUF2298 domain-containing protein [Anaerolineae bacterium]